MSTSLNAHTNAITIVDGASPSHGHAHAVGMDACLDLINSVEFSDGVPEEGLPTAADAMAFFTRRGLVHEDALRRQVSDAGEDAWLARIHGMRASLREIWDAQVAGRYPDQAALDTVNAALREAPRIELVRGDGCCGIGHRHTTIDPTGEALARVIQPLVEAIAAGSTDRFRVCANDGCRWVFEDTSRGGRRRWCDMTSCGNRAKVRRYRTRHRAGEQGPGGPVATPSEGAPAAGA